MLFPTGSWYAWRVIASDSFGNQVISESRVFAVDPQAPPAPVLLAPMSGATITTSTIEFCWAWSSDTPHGNSDLALAAGSTQARCNFQVSRSSSFATLMANDTTTETRAFVVLSSGDSGTIYWRVAAVDRLGNRAVSTSSFQRSVPADTVPPQPPLELRGVALETGGVRLTWQPSPSSDMSGGGYRIYWDSGFRTNADTLLDYAAHQATGPITYITGVLRCDSTYRFRVQSIDALGNADLNMNLVEVRVVCGVPPYAQTQIVTPHSGHRVTRTGGVEVVTRVLGSPAQKAAVSAVRFQYRPAGGSWTDMLVSSRQSNPATYGGTGNANVHWNAQALADGLVDIRAVPMLSGSFSADSMSEVVRIELVSNADDANVHSDANHAADTFRVDHVVFRNRQDTIVAITPSGRRCEVMLDSGAAPSASDTCPVKLRVALSPTSPIETQAIRNSQRQEVGLVAEVAFSDSSQPGADVWNIGSNAKFKTDPEKLPLSFALGAAWQPTGRWLLTADYEAVRSMEGAVKAGVEYRPVESLALRLGYDGRNKAGHGITFGTGFRMKDLQIDYAFIPYGDLGDEHRVSAEWAFGEMTVRPKVARSGYFEETMRRDVSQGPRRPKMSAMPEEDRTPPRAEAPSPERITPAVVLPVEEQIDALEIDARHASDKGDVEKAAGLYRRIILLDPANTTALYNLATIQYNREDYYDAAHLYAEVTRHDPSDGDAWFYLGMSRLKLGDEMSARDAFEKTLEVNPTNRWARNYLGR